MFGGRQRSACKMRTEMQVMNCHHLEDDKYHGKGYIMDYQHELDLQAVTYDEGILLGKFLDYNESLKQATKDAYATLYRFQLRFWQIETFDAKLLGQTEQLETEFSNLQEDLRAFAIKIGDLQLESINVNMHVYLNRTGKEMQTSERQNETFQQGKQIKEVKEGKAKLFQVSKEINLFTHEKVAQLRQEQVELEDKFAKALNRLNAMKFQLSGSNKHSSHLCNGLKKSQQTNTPDRQTSELLKNEINPSDIDIDQKEECYGNMRQKLTESKSNLEKIVEELLDSTNDEDNLAQCIKRTSLEAYLTKDKSTLNCLEAVTLKLLEHARAKKQLAQELKDKDLKISVLTEKSDQFQAEKSNVEQELFENKREMDHFAMCLREKDSEVTLIKNKFDQLQTQKFKLEQGLLKSIKDKKKLEKCLRDRDRETTLMKDQINLLQVEKSKLEEELADSIKNSNQFDEWVKKQNLQIAFLENKVDLLEDGKSKLVQELLEFSKVNKQL